MVAKVKICYWHFDEKSYHTPRIYQIVLFQIITYFGRCSTALLINTSKHEEIKK